MVLKLSFWPMRPAPTPGYCTRRADDGADLLVVEDVPVTLEFLRAILTDCGYRVRCATSVQDALRALAEGLPELVVLDLFLPDANGLEICRHLRRLPEGDDIPVLIVTVDDDPKIHGESIRAGADDFLRKPILPAELQTRVRSLLRLRRQRAQLRADRDAILDLQVREERTVQFVMHDLKNMLAALMVSVERSEEDGSREEWGRHRKRIGACTRNLQELVSNYLDVSLGSHADLHPRAVELDTQDWLRRTVDEFENFGPRQRHSIRVDPQGIQAFKGDPLLLRRVLFNLLDNASRFAPDDSAILVGAEPSPDGGHCLLWVADQGPGVPDSMKEAIFSRLVTDALALPSRGGKGLGLAFCKLVAELHGGGIRVEDLEPQGSRFVLELPL